MDISLTALSTMLRTSSSNECRFKARRSASVVASLITKATFVAWWWEGSWDRGVLGLRRGDREEDGREMVKTKRRMGREMGVSMR